MENCVEIYERGITNMTDIYSSKQTTINISEKSNMIWNNANHLVGL